MNRDAIYPEFFARFYDNIYHELRGAADHDYFINKIKSAERPVLEVGVGTGRFFLEALKQGVDIYGLDISETMVNVLKRKLNSENHHRVMVQDICSMEPGRKFNLILAPFRVFMHLLSIKDQLKALNRVYQFLNEGGTFIFDLFVPNLQMLINGMDNVKDFDGEHKPGQKLQRFVSMKADLINQISKVDFKLVWEENDQTHSETWHTSLHFFFRYELELLLQISPFSNYSIYGDFKENSLDQNSKEFIVHCKK